MPRSNPPCLPCFTDGETKIQERESEQLRVTPRQVSQFLVSVFFSFTLVPLPFLTKMITSEHDLKHRPEDQGGEIHLPESPSPPYA